VASPFTCTPQLPLRRTFVPLDLCAADRGLPRGHHLDPVLLAVLEDAILDDRDARHEHANVSGVVHTGVLQQQRGALENVHLPVQVASLHLRRAADPRPIPLGGVVAHVMSLMAAHRAQPTKFLRQRAPGGRATKMHYARPATCSNLPRTQRLPYAYGKR